MKTLIFLLILGVSKWGQTQSVSSTQDQLKTAVSNFTRLQKSNPRCDRDFKTPAPACSAILQFLNSEEKEDSLFGFNKKLKSSYQDCKTKHLVSDTNNQQFPRSQDLAEFYQSGFGLKLGSEIHAQIRRCASSGTDSDKESVSKLYYSYKKINETQLAQIKEMATLDMYLGLAPLDKFDCSKITFESNQKECQNLKSACGNGTLPQSLQQMRESLVQQSENSKNQISEYLKQKEALELQFKKMRGRAQISSLGEDLKKQMAAIETLISIAQSRSPWLKGEAYKESKSQGRTEIDSILDQFKVDRQKQASRYADGVLVQTCLAGGTHRACTTEKVRSYLRTAIPMSPMLSPSPTPKDRIANEYLDFQECLQSTTDKRLKTASEIKMAAVDITLTAASTALSLGGALVARGTLAATRSSMILRSIELADQGLNLTNLGFGVAKSVQECQKQVESLAPSDKSSENKCVLSSTIKSSQQLEDFDNCQSSVIWAAAGLTPFAGAFGGKWLAGKLIKKDSSEPSFWPTATVSKTPSPSQVDSSTARPANINSSPKTSFFRSSPPANSLEREVPSIPHRDTFAAEIEEKRKAWNQLHPQDKDNFPMPAHKEAVDDLKQKLLDLKSQIVSDYPDQTTRILTQKKRDKTIKDLLQQIEELEKNNYPNRDSLQLASQATYFFDRAVNTVASTYSVEKELKKQYGLTLTLSTEDNARLYLKQQALNPKNGETFQPSLRKDYEEDLIQTVQKELDKNGIKKSAREIVRRAQFSSGFNEASNSLERFGHEVAHQTIVLTSNAVSDRAIAEAALFNIQIVGVRKDPIWADNSLMSAQRFFDHDFNHMGPQFQNDPIRKKIVNLSTAKKNKLLTQIDSLPNTRQRELADFALTVALREGSYKGIFGSGTHNSQQILQNIMGAYQSLKSDKLLPSEAQWIEKWWRTHLPTD